MKKLSEVITILIRAKSVEQAQTWREAAAAEDRSLNQWILRALDTVARSDSRPRVKI